MNRKFIFAFTILLTTLSIVNAVPSKLHKRVTAFEPCTKVPLDVTKMVPDPLVSGERGEFYVSGKLAKTIPEGYILGALYFDVSTDTPKLIDYNAATICEPDGALECPYPAGKFFDVILSGKIPPLPQSYGILVALGDAKLKTVIGCAAGIVNNAAQPSPPAATPPPSAPTPPPPPPPTSTAAPPSSAPSPEPSGGGKGAGGIQDSILISNLFKENI
jgi:hypothetical protein